MLLFFFSSVFHITCGLVGTSSQVIALLICKAKNLGEDISPPPRMKPWEYIHDYLKLT